MNELTKVWQVWNRTKISRLKCNTHKNIRENRVETAQVDNKILRATNDVFKVECCGSSLLTSIRKRILGKIVDF
jgi:hypothetical protein